jgi:hypothetical protein
MEATEKQDSPQNFMHKIAARCFLKTEPVRIEGRYVATDGRILVGLDACPADAVVPPTDFWTATRIAEMLEILNAPCDSGTVSMKDLRTWCSIAAEPCEFCGERLGCPCRRGYPSTVCGVLLDRAILWSALAHVDAPISVMVGYSTPHKPFHFSAPGWKVAIMPMREYASYHPSFSGQVSPR